MFSKLNTTARILTPLLLALAIPYQLAAAGPAPVDLRSTANFAILAGAAVTSTGGGIINGNVGASPIAGSAIGVTCAQVNGTIYAVDAAGPACAVINDTLLTTAKNDLTTAYNDAAGRTPVPSGPFLNPGLTPGAGNIGGMNLAPGLYKFTTTALITGSDVTLTGGPDDVWIFQCAQDLQLGSGIKVILAGGAQAKNIFWQVGTSAVLGTSSDFKGTIMADQAITMNTSSTIQGRALAFTAGVSFNGSGISVPTPTGVAPEIAVEQPLGTNLVDGVSSKDFGSVAVGTNTSLTFTITNPGSANLTGLGITLDGTDSAMFSVTANPTAPVSPSGSTTFTVQFAPVGTGLKTAALHIANNDSDENPFDITITGTGTGGGGGASTNLFAIAYSPITLNRQNGLFEQTVHLTNSSPDTIVAVRLLIRDLPDDVQVYNASGFTNDIPFVQYNLPLATAEAVDLLIEYYRANRDPNFQPIFEVQAATALSVTATGAVLAIDPQRPPFQSGRFFIEFSATPGRRYAVQYSSDMTSWKTADPIITAPANRVQWYDDGPPKTEGKPTTIGSRFYRVMVLP